MRIIRNLSFSGHIDDVSALAMFFEQLRLRQFLPLPLSTVFWIDFSAQLYRWSNPLSCCKLRRRRHLCDGARTAYSVQVLPWNQFQIRRPFTAICFADVFRFSACSDTPPYCRNSPACFFDLYVDEAYWRNNHVAFYWNSGRWPLWLLPRSFTATRRVQGNR